VFLLKIWWIPFARLKLSFPTSLLMAIDVFQATLENLLFKPLVMIVSIDLLMLSLF